MAKPTRQELTKLREDYILKREELLKTKVNSLQVKLFDLIFKKFVSSLELSNGVIVNNGKNISSVAALDKIYKEFQIKQNIPTVKSFLRDIDGIHDVNTEYFNTINPKGAKTSAPIVKEAVNKQLGLDEKGNIKQGGFTDKFLRDQSVLKSIKKISTKAISSGQSFTTFKENLQEHIQGNPKIKDSGKLQQYYRNYAYDTFQKVDSLEQLEFGEKLGLRYFVYGGGLIKTSRNFCIHYNGRVVDSKEFSQLTYEGLPKEQQDGIPVEDWEPLVDRGGYGCRHSINWLPTSIALSMQSSLNKKAAAKEKLINSKK